MHLGESTGGNKWAAQARLVWQFVLGVEDFSKAASEHCCLTLSPSIPRWVMLCLGGMIHGKEMVSYLTPSNWMFGEAMLTEATPSN